METRVAVVAIIVEDQTNIDRLNEILHEYNAYILARMGIPYRKRGISIISIALDAPQNVVNSLAGRIGKLGGISAKTIYSNKTYPPEE